MVNKEFDDIEQMARSYGLTDLQIEEQKRKILLMTKIANIIRKRQLTHSEAAKVSNVGRTVITGIMNRSNLDISTDRLIRILNGLGLTVSFRFSEALNGKRAS